MPVRFEISRGMLRVCQSFDFPAVYLDHWAVRLFARDPAQGLRFGRALKAARGALVFSAINMVEITGASDPRSTEEIAQLLEALLPNIYFALFDLQAAARQESAPRDLRTRLPAPPDIELLRLVGLQRPDDFRPFTIAGLIRTVGANRDALGTQWNNCNQSLAKLIADVRANGKVISEAKDFRGHPENLPTLAVMQELFRPFTLDQGLPVAQNDPADFMHALISMVYCDYALLDGKWEDLHGRMVRRFAEVNHPIRLANVYSGRRGGVERFLLALEASAPPQLEAQS